MSHDIRLVCFDMDDTLIHENSWYALNMALGITHDEDTEMYDAYVKGSLSYADWTEKLLALYRERGRATKARVTEALSKYQLYDGAKEAVAHLKGKGYELAVVSGSFDVLAELVADELGITHRKGSASLVFDGRDMLVDLKTNGDEAGAKVRHLEEICAKVGVTLEECACVGDGGNDRELFIKTGHGITFPNTPIADVAWKTITSLHDLTEVL